MAIKYKSLVEAYRGLPVSDANRYLKQAISEGDVNENEFSLTELFVECFGSDAHNDCRRRKESITKIMEAGDAVSSASFSNISGQIVFSTVMDAFNQEANWASALVPTVQSNFKSEKIPGVTEIGDEAAVVNEGEEYPTSGVSEDYIETPDTKKRGTIIPVTREAILFDRTNLLIERARDVGKWLGLNKEKRLLDMIIDENSTDHRYNWKGTVYGSYVATPWDNLSTGAALVDYTDINAALLKFAAMTDPATGDPISIVPKQLIVDPSLQMTAFRILNSTRIDQGAISADIPITISASPITSAYTLVTSSLLSARQVSASAAITSWYLGDVAAYGRYMQNWPMTVTQAPVNSELEFSRDIVMRFKASERGAAVVVQPRAIVKSTAA